jgi:hypothetical protein
MTPRKPHLLSVIADGGQKKGGACYGSFQISGYPDEPPLTFMKLVLHESSTSTEAEAEILCEGVKVAVDGMKARKLQKRFWMMLVESDSQTLILKLREPSTTRANHILKERYLEEAVTEAEEQVRRGRPGAEDGLIKAIKQLSSFRFMRKRMEDIWDQSKGFASVEYRWCGRSKTVSTFGH